MRIILILLSTLSLFSACAMKKVERAELKIMSFNIRYNEPNDGVNNWIYRRQACVDMINDHRPDVFGIQEGLIDQVQFLDSALTSYVFVGVGRDSLIKNNEYSAIFFRTDKLKLISSSTFWLSETPKIPSKGWDAKYQRIVTWARFRNLHDEKEFVVMNTHFDHKGSQAKLESAKLIAQKAAELSGDTLTVFTTGDFNTLPDDELLTPIYAYMKSAKAEAPITDSMGTTNSFKVAQEGKVIDYIFYRNAIAKVCHTITKDYGVPYISDHYPIIATFEY